MKKKNLMHRIAAVPHLVWMVMFIAPEGKNKKRRVTGPAEHAYCYMMSAQYNFAPLYGNDSDDDENNGDNENRAHCHMAGTPQDPHDSEREVQIEEEENEEAIIVNTRA